MSSRPEVWLRGPLADYPPMLMPVAHSLLQVREEIERLEASVPADLVWVTPGGAASIGFHIRHTAGAIDRLLTYARGEMLTAEQRTFLAGEEAGGEPISALVAHLNQTIDAALAVLRTTETRDPAALLAQRRVGRAGMPSTVLGLLFHAAEHSTRHAGQAITTARILTGRPVAPLEN